MIDPIGKRIGRNDPCWCGSAIKYKKCHLNRADAKPLHPLASTAQIDKAINSNIECACRSNLTQCSEKRGKNHSLPRSRCLNSIAEKNHVLTISNKTRKASSSGQLHYGPYAENVSTDAASTFRAFCEYHDGGLFRNADNLETSDLTAFLTQVFYKSVCFELYRKRMAHNADDVWKKLDIGMHESSQMDWQRLRHNYSILQSVGWKILDDLRNKIEAAVLGQLPVELSYVHLELETNIGIAGLGCFQPSHTYEGNYLRNVWKTELVHGKPVGERRDSLVAYSFPSKERTVLGLICLTEETRSIEYLNSVVKQTGRFADSVLGTLFLHSENVFFKPSLFNNLDESIKRSIFKLSSVGIAEPEKPEDFERAKAITFVGQAISGKFRQSFTPPSSPPSP